MYVSDIHDLSPHPFPTRRSSDLAVEPALEPQGRHLRGEHVVAVHLPRDHEGLAHRLAHELAGGGAQALRGRGGGVRPQRDRKSTRLNSSHMSNSYADYYFKKKKL